jgi:hypothetical protein
VSEVDNEKQGVDKGFAKATIHTHLRLMAASAKERQP